MKFFDMTAEGSIDAFCKVIYKRREESGADVDSKVASILADVKDNGDEALCRYSMEFDNVDLKEAGIEFSKEAISEAISNVDPDLLEVIRQAATNIREFHEKEYGYEQSWRDNYPDGSSFGIKVTPLSRVGVYVPGGRAPLPSSVLMNVIPAKVAGVKEIIMCTPPGRGGKGDPAILAAAYIAGVDRIFKVGGAQAIGAMAYGTKTIPAVDKITGPGNAYVAAAKSQVFGRCGIDMIAGPSEILIIADSSANPEFVAADLLSQAEHDPMAASILLTTDSNLAAAVLKSLNEQLGMLSRRSIAQKSIEDNGLILLVKSLRQAAEISDIIAPEHLELCVSNPEVLLEDVHNAGAVFCGNWSPEPMGDYFCGSNHILPTGGTAKFSSPLGVWDFVKRTSVIHYTKEKFLRDSSSVIRFAESEGLTAHARAVSIRR